MDPVWDVRFGYKKRSATFQGVLDYIYKNPVLIEDEGLPAIALVQQSTSEALQAAVQSLGGSPEFIASFLIRSPSELPEVVHV